MTSLPAAVLWDLDGTLIDTEPYWIACEYELVAQFGGRWTDADAHSIIGFDLLAAAEVIRDRGSVNLPPQDIVDRLTAGVIARVRQHMPWRPGAQELLVALNRAGVPCALVTMSWQNVTDEVIRQIPPGTFQAVVTGDMVKNGKPHPEPYRRAADELRVDPLSCVAIEDSPTGVASAEAAGCVVVAVPHVVPIPPARHRVSLTTLLGVTPEQLGEFVETTPPPESARGPAASARSRRPYDADADIPPARPPRPRGVDYRAWARGRGLLSGRRRLIGAVAAVLLLLVGGLGVWWFAIRDTGKESYAPGPFRVHTWATPTQLERSTPELGERANVFHQVSPFWYETTGATAIGLIEDPGFDPEQAAEFIADARDLGIPLVPSILDHNGRGGMAAILADPAQRQAHIDTIAAFAASNDFDGIDIDYENFAFTDGEDTWEATRPNWVAFIEELGARLHAEGRILTVSVPPVFNDSDFDDRSYWVYDYGAIAPHVDAIRVMAYDFSSTNTAPGPVAPLDWVTRIVEGTTDAAGGPEKLVLGIPLYGYNWVTSTTGDCPSTAEDDISQSRRRIDELLLERNPTPPVFDPVTAETTFTYQLTVEGEDTSCTQTREVHYVDAEGIRQRMQLSIDSGMLGVSLFAFGYEDASIWTDIAEINATLETTIPDDAATTTVAAATTTAPAATTVAATTTIAATTATTTPTTTPAATTTTPAVTTTTVA